MYCANTGAAQLLRVFDIGALDQRSYLRHLKTVDIHCCVLRFQLNLRRSMRPSERKRSLVIDDVSAWTTHTAICRQRPVTNLQP